MNARIRLRAQPSTGARPRYRTHVGAALRAVELRPSTRGMSTPPCGNLSHAGYRHEPTVPRWINPRRRTRTRAGTRTSADAGRPSTADPALRCPSCSRRPRRSSGCPRLAAAPATDHAPRGIDRSEVTTVVAAQKLHGTKSNGSSPSTEAYKNSRSPTVRKRGSADRARARSDRPTPSSARPGS